MRMYLNKIYDCDTLNSKDNDGGCTVDAEVDPNRTSDETFTNPYAGYGSVLFNNIYLQQVVWTDSSGTELSLRTVAAAMRNVQATIDGVTLHPFSPEGATHFFIDKRLKNGRNWLVLTTVNGNTSPIPPPLMLFTSMPCKVLDLPPFRLSSKDVGVFVTAISKPVISSAV